MTLSVQFLTMVSMILMGVWIGAAVDTYGRFMHPNRWTWVLFFCDILFWVVQGLLIFTVLLYVNEGDIRFYIFVALFCGFAAYRALFQSFYNKLLNAFIRFGNYMIRVALNLSNVFIVKPIRGTTKLLFMLITFIGSTIIAIFLFIFKILMIPLNGIQKMIWRFLPKSFKNLVKRVAGLLKIMQNKIKKWFGRI
ncbi:spore cortex biosynthesis protein YabQ [Pueribacillus theae]|uniref:Spore cortex biosynthesis protein YabQ n=1 Tax=Pueribacillus theae TaxID=2171751 RepID=A0A2U1K562_9BACI|nr:spore cortex biosynthesis protein YabQ [Pueribacillus theae]PWA12133.1 spore cortex biosynthesis protein YabQ [Pueribacillus theae]